MSLPSVTEILSDAGVGFDMSHLPPSYSERGTLIHKYAENLILGKTLPEIPQEWRGYAEAVDSFIYEVRPEPMLVEATLTHSLMGFEGHPDLPSMVGVIPTLFDYKTGSIPLYCGPQLAGYEILLKHVLPHIKSWRRVAVLLQEDGKYKLKEYTEDRDRAVFLEAYHGYIESRGAKWTHR